MKCKYCEKKYTNIFKWFWDLGVCDWCVKGNN